VARSLLRSLAIGAWIGLLLLPLTLRVEKRAQDEAEFHPRPWRAAYVGAGVAAAGALFALGRRLRAGAAWGSRLAGPRAAAGALARRAGRRGRAALVGLVLAGAAALPLGGNPYYVAVATQTTIYVCLALGLNVVVGQAGLLVLGYAAFYGAGAYTYAILSRDLGLTFWLGMPAGALAAALFGLLLGAPTLRLRGDYLAIVTLGFGEMMRIVLMTADRLTGGPNGIAGIARPRLLGWEASDAVLYLLTLALVVVVAAVSQRLNRSRIGRAWMAMREDETAARAMGIDVTRMRLLAFSISAAWAGVAGAFFAAKQSFISPESFSFLESVTVLAMVVLGGMGSIAGVVAGAVLLSLLPEVLREVQDYRMISVAGLMIMMMIFRPQGLFPDVRRQLELADEAERA
jgi:branched-chain amino acid transport system permease protein